MGGGITRVVGGQGSRLGDSCKERGKRAPVVDLASGYFSWRREGNMTTRVVFIL